MRIQRGPNFQLIINSTFARSAKYTPFVLMIGIKMKNKDYLKINEMFDEKYVIYKMKDMREQQKGTSCKYNKKARGNLTKPEKNKNI